MKGGELMPVISRFYGIIIKMYFQQSEHQPPHIHAMYAEFSGSIAIADGSILDGDLPEKALMLVREWLKLHKDEVQAIWDSQEFKSIPGLE